MTIQINDTMTLDASGLTLTKDGYLTGDARVARAGNVQYYYGREIGVKDKADQIFGVYRDPKAVFDNESMLSLAGRPVTRGHPPEGVQADNWKDLAIGQVGGTIRRDGEYVVAPMAIMDAQAAKEVQAGARSLSAGYTCNIVADSGVNEAGHEYQYRQDGPVRFNHVAYLPDNNPRAGNTRIGDSWGITPITDFKPGSKPTTKGDHKMSDNLKTVVLGDSAVQVAVSDVAAIEQYKADSAKALADATASHEAAIAAKDTEIGTLTAQLQEAKDAANIDVDQLVADRAELVAKVKAIDADIDPAGKTDAQLRKAAVAAKMGDAMVKDASDDMIRGMFAVVAKDAKTNPAARAFGNGLDGAADPLNDAYAAYDARMSGQSKE